MNISNILSLTRLILTIFFLLSIFYRRFEIALFLFVIQALSDFFDGLFARLFRRKTELGAYLDPLADKIMLNSSYMILYLYGFVPLWFVLIIFLRDFIIASGFLLLSHFAFPLKPSPTLLGKGTTISQMSTIIYLLYFGSGPYLTTFFYLTSLFTVASFFEYLLKGINLFLRRGATITNKNI